MLFTWLHCWNWAELHIYNFVAICEPPTNFLTVASLGTLIIHGFLLPFLSIHDMLTNRFLVLLLSNISKLKTWQTDELENFMMLSPIHFKHTYIAVLNSWWSKCAWFKVLSDVLTYFALTYVVLHMTIIFYSCYLKYFPLTSYFLCDY